MDGAATAVAAALAAPLSRKRAMLAVLLVDQAVDARFDRGAGGDILAFRAAVASRHPALGLVLALAAMTGAGPRLVVEPVEVPPADYPALGVEDYMVSLYNDRSVPRVLAALPDGGRRDIHDLLAEALADLATL